jgi:hypothetical protein
VSEPVQHRVFIGRTNRVMVVDADNGKLRRGMAANPRHGAIIDTPLTFLIVRKAVQASIRALIE